MSDLTCIHCGGWSCRRCDPAPELAAARPAWSTPLPGVLVIHDPGPTPRVLPDARPTPPMPPLQALGLEPAPEPMAAPASTAIAPLKATTELERYVEELFGEVGKLRLEVDRLQSENIGLRVQLVEANAALLVRQLSGAA